MERPGYFCLTWRSNLNGQLSLQGSLPGYPRHCQACITVQLPPLPSLCFLLLPFTGSDRSLINSLSLVPETSICDNVLCQAPHHLARSVLYPWATSIHTVRSLEDGWTQESFLPLPKPRAIRRAFPTSLLYKREDITISQEFVNLPSSLSSPTEARGGDRSHTCCQPPESLISFLGLHFQSLWHLTIPHSLFAYWQFL